MTQSVCLCRAVGDFKYRVLLYALYPSIVATFGILGFQLKGGRGALVAAGMSTVLVVPIAVQVNAYFSAWCCVSDAHLGALCDTLIQTTEALSKAGVKHWICYGSLLGALRDNDLPMQSIPWEHDMDLCVYSKDLPTLLDIVRATPGIQVLQWPDTAQTVVVPDPWPWRLRVGRAYVDIRLWGPDPSKEGNIVAVKQTGNSFVPFPPDGQCKRSLIEPFSQVRVLAFCLAPAKLWTHLWRAFHGDQITVCDRSIFAPAKPVEALKNMLHNATDKSAPQFPGNLHGAVCQLYVDCSVPLHKLPVYK